MNFSYLLLKKYLKFKNIQTALVDSSVLCDKYMVLYFKATVFKQVLKELN